MHYELVMVTWFWIENDSFFDEKWIGRNISHYPVLAASRERWYTGDGRGDSDSGSSDAEKNEELEDIAATQNRICRYETGLQTAEED